MVNKRTKRARKALNGVTRKGKNMMHGGGWRLLHKDRLYVGTLVNVINHGSLRLAVFRVPKGRGE